MRTGVLRSPRAWLPPVLVAAGAAIVTAILGATITDLGPWYRSLRQPPWSPPDATFPIAWTLIYTLTAISAVTAWRRAPASHASQRLIGFFALNGFLNLLWSFLFFRLHLPDWAVAEVVFLALSVAILIAETARWSRTAPWLLAPYLVWVGCAAALNLAVVRLNGPF